MGEGTKRLRRWTLCDKRKTDTQKDVGLSFGEFAYAR
jgi:hypothetical protein